MKKTKKLPVAKTAEEQHPIRAALTEVLIQGEETALFADGLEDAIVGMTCAQPGRSTLIVYDYQKCAGILVKRDKMDWDEAYEFLDFNTVGAWMGDQTPVFINTVKHVLTANGLGDALRKPKKGPKVDPRQMRLL